MKILIYYPGFLNTWNNLAGTNRMILTVAGHLSKTNEVVIVSESANKYECASGIRVIPLSGKLRYEMISDFDVVFFCCGNRANELNKPKYQKWIRYQHCWDINIREYTKKYDIVVGVSKKHFLNLVLNGIPKNKVAYIPNCINTNKFYSRNVDRDERSIMYCGTIIEGKGLHKVVEAVTGTKWKMVDVYGSPDMTRDDCCYEKMVRSMRGSDRVVFNGSVDKDTLAEAYSRNSILCLPSEVESFSLVSAEAQACGCIPVVHDCGGISEAIGPSGIMYKPNTANELHRVLKRISILGIREMQREVAIGFAKNKFSVKKSMEFLDSIMRGVVS